MSLIEDEGGVYFDPITSGLVDMLGQSSFPVYGKACALLIGGPSFLAPEG
jgi:hypothetical protein